MGASVFDHTSSRFNKVCLIIFLPTSIVDHSCIRLVPFVLMLLIIEEIIPLVVLYTPGLLPSTCILPSQQERILNKRRQMQTKVYQAKDKVLLDTIKNLSNSGPAGFQLDRLDARATKVLCR